MTWYLYVGTEFKKLSNCGGRIISVLAHYIEDDLFGIPSLSLCWDCCWTAAIDAASQDNPRTAAAGGLEAKNLLIFLCCSENERKAFVGLFFCGSVSDDTHFGWFDLICCFQLYLSVNMFTSLCREFEIRIMFQWLLIVRLDI